MATVAENIAILNRYFDTGGELGPVSNTLDIYERAMRELLWDGGANPFGRATPQATATRAAFAKEQIFERTLSPPSLSPGLFVRPSIQLALFDGLYKIGTGGAWSSPDPAGLTPWLHTEGGSQYAFENALSDPPRVYRGRPFELPPEVIASMLRLLRDVALPVAWIGPFGRSEVFAQLEVRTASSAWSTTTRRTVLALVSQAKGRISTELARIASGGAFQSFPTGNGQATPTVPPAGRPWYRSGWTWLWAGVGAIGGGAFAARGPR